MDQTIISALDFQRMADVYKVEMPKIVAQALRRNGRQLDMANLLVTPAVLRSRRLFVNGNNVYKWDFREETRNAGGDATDKLLANQDSFISTHMGLYLSNKPEATPQIAQLATWADPSVFPDQAGYDVPHLDGIYNGIVEAKYGTQTVLSVDTELLRRQKATFAAAPIPAVAAGVGAASPLQRFAANDRTVMDGAFPFVFAIDGYGSREFQLTFNSTGLNLQPTQPGSPFVTEVVLMLFGWRIINVSQWQSQG